MNRDKSKKSLDSNKEGTPKGCKSCKGKQKIKYTYDRMPNIRKKLLNRMKAEEKLKLGKQIMEKEECSSESEVFISDYEEDL